MEMEIGIDHFHESDHDPDLSDETVAALEEEQALSFAVEVVSRMHTDDGSLQSSATARVLRLLDARLSPEPQTQEETYGAIEAVQMVLYMYGGRFRDTSRAEALRRVCARLRLVKHIVTYPVPTKRTWCGKSVEMINPQQQLRSTDLEAGPLDDVDALCAACRGTMEHVRAVLEAGMYPERAHGVDR